MQTLCRTRAHLQILCRFDAALMNVLCTLFLKSVFGRLCRLCPSVHVCNYLACILCTLCLWCVSSRSCASCIAVSTSMLALRRLLPNDAWLLVFFALVLTAVLIRPLVTFVEIVRQKALISKFLRYRSLQLQYRNSISKCFNIETYVLRYR